MNKLNLDYYKECPICTSKNIKDKYKLKDYVDRSKLKDNVDRSKLKNYIISECLKCSVLFVKEKLTKNFLKKYYQQKIEGEFIYGDDNEKCLNYYYRKLKSEIEKIKPKGKILDIGCSAGFFLNQMKGWERHGIEIAEEFGNTAKEKIGSKIFIGSFEEYPIKKNYFDVITLQDVFDHFINPYKNLKKCYDMLKPNGLLVMKVHNISCLYAKITGPNFYPIMPPIHLFYFNKKSMKIILNRVGFKFYNSKFITHVSQLKTIFHRLSNGKPNTVSYKIYKLLNNNMLGKIKFPIILNDIITVFAIKNKKD